MQLRMGLLSALLCAYSLDGQASAKPKTGTSGAKKVLRLGNGSEPKDLSPIKATGEPDGIVIKSLFEGLISIDAATQQVIPGMAESWTLSPDGKVYTFKIRKNAKWSDGKSLGAKDFVYSLQKFLDPKTASEYAYQGYYLVNAEEYNIGKIKDPNQVGVRATDDYTLELRLKSPTAYFLSLLDMPFYSPIPQHVVEKFPGDEWTKAGNMVSNGPFKLDEWRINSHIKVVVNEHYWNKAKLRLEEVYFYATENSSTEEKSFLNGELDFTYTVPDLKVSQYLSQNQKNPTAYNPIRISPFLATYLYRLNVKKPPLNDVRVRKALSLTLDRELLTQRILGAGQKAATGVTPVGFSTYKPKAVLNTKVSPENLKEAQKLLAEAGYPKGAGMPPIELLYNTTEEHKRIATAVQQMWKKQLGVEIVLVNQEWKVYLATESRGDFMISRGGWVADYEDPNTFLDLWTSESGMNRTGWQSKAFDELIDQAKSELDAAKRLVLLAQAEELVLESYAIIPVFSYVSKHLVSDRLRIVKQDGSLVPWSSNLINRTIVRDYALVD